MQKILIIRFSSIGDIVLTTPVIRCLKEQLPDAEIHYLTKEKFYPVIKANPHITRIHTFNEKLGELIKELKTFDFDYIVDLHKNLRSSRVKMALRKASGSYNKLNKEKWLLVNFGINKLPDIHIVDRYFKAVEGLGISNDHKGLDYFIPDGDRLGQEELPTGFADGFVALVIGGMHYTKMFPEEKILALCELIDMPVMLMGGPDEHKLAERIKERCRGGVFNSCGLYNINQSASVISLATKVVTNDTGLMHIAAAFKKEIFSIWGNTIPGFGMAPYMPGNESRSHIMEVDGLTCRPCSKIGYNKCPRKHFRCMMDIDVVKLAAAINT
ncbi:MAG: glycosyltransferase family 9 protein [Bacteroidales bacterium]|nr:glycosyltransferase family 9 protein [Bacteroidales bacterium]